MLATMRSSVAISSPSSRIKPQESQRGIAPLTASQLANIAAGEKQRGDNVAVRGKGQPIALGGQFLKGNAGLIFLLVQKRVGEGAHKKLTD